MTEGDTTRTTDTTSVVRVCPLCGGTGRRRIRRPGTPRHSSTLVNCTCAATPVPAVKNTEPAKDTP
jgi:hypothetical protein